MEPNIISVKSISAGWLKMQVYDNIQDLTRQMRVSYLDNLFENFLMACLFLLNDIKGTYEIDLDQEGFEAKIRLHRWSENTIRLEIVEDFFEDEIPYNATKKEWDEFLSQESIPTTLMYSNINIQDFIFNLIKIVEENRKDYNEGFALTPSEEVDINLLEKIKKMYYKKFFLKGE